MQLPEKKIEMPSKNTVTQVKHGNMLNKNAVSVKVFMASLFSIRNIFFVTSKER